MAPWPGHDELEVAMVGCECPEDCGMYLLLGSEAGADRWFAFGDMDVEPGAAHPGDGVLFESALEALEGDTYAGPEFVPRVAALFGMPWREMDQGHRAAQLRILLTSPAWFARTLLSFSPDELKRLRANVEGDASSVTRALSALHRYLEPAKGARWQ